MQGAESSQEPPPVKCYAPKPEMPQGELHLSTYNGGFFASIRSSRSTRSVFEDLGRFEIIDVGWPDPGVLNMAPCAPCVRPCWISTDSVTRFPRAWVA